MILETEDLTKSQKRGLGRPETNVLDQQTIEVPDEDRKSPRFASPKKQKHLGAIVELEGEEEEIASEVMNSPHPTDLNK